MTPRTYRLAFGLACGLAGVLILFRSAVWIWWPQSHFDSDQAVVGLRKPGMEILVEPRLLIGVLP